MPTPYSYFYDAQIKKYIYQFLKIFSSLQVEYNVDRDNDGQKDRKTCNIMYSDMDRIAANTLFKKNTFQATSLPIMSCMLTTIEVDPERRKSKYHKENVVRYTEGGKKVTQKIMGVPYKLNFDLSVWTSNNNQMVQLLEQIMLLFNPKITIQTSDNIIDWNYITHVELLAITPEQNYPTGTDDRVLIYTLSFVVDIMLDFPAEERTGIIENIITNIKDDTFDPAGVDLDSITIDSETWTGTP